MKCKFDIVIPLFSSYPPIPTRTVTYADGSYQPAPQSTALVNFVLICWTVTLSLRECAQCTPCMLKTANICPENSPRPPT